MPANRRLEVAYARVRRNPGRRMRSIQKFGMPPAGTVLEIGCGDGLNLKAMRQLGYRHVIGLDISDFLLDKARGLAPLVRGSAWSLPVQSGSIDAVYMDSVFCDLPDFADCAREVHRVLKPAGLFCCIEPRRSLARTAFDRLTFSPLARYISVLKYRRQEYEEDWAMLQNWLDHADDFRRYLRQLGFNEAFFRKGALGFWLKLHK